MLPLQLLVACLSWISVTIVYWNDYLLDEFLNLFWEIRSQRFVSTALYVWEQLLFVGVPEWRLACQALVNQHTQQVPINHFGMTSAPKHLRSQISCTSTKWMRHSCFFRKSEICQAGISIPVKNDITWFQVSVNDFSLVKSFQSKRNLCSIFLHQILFEGSFSLDEFKHITSRAVIHDQIQLSLGLERIMELNDVRMVNCWKDFPLCHGVPENVLLHDSGLVQSLHGILFFLIDVLDKINLAESSFSKKGNFLEIGQTYLLNGDVLYLLGLNWSATGRLFGKC